MTLFVFALVSARTSAAETSSLPTWSKKFDAVIDPDVQQLLNSYRKQGWVKVFLEKGGHISGRELIANTAVTRSDLVAAIARDEAYLRRAGVSYAAAKPSPSECAAATRGVTAVVCDERRRTSELNAVEGFLELLPAYSAQLPPAPASAHYGSVAGKELARVLVTITASSHAPRQIDVTPSSSMVEAAVGDTLIVHLSTSETTVASGVTLTPAFDALQLPLGKRRGATRLFFPAMAVKAGTATLQFFGPLLEKASATCAAISATTSNCWAGYVLQSGGPFGFISGSWTVPGVFTDKLGLSSTWIGIDGFGTDDLIQIGTESDFSNGALGIGAGSKNIYAWFEFVPQTQCGFLFITTDCQAGINEVVFPGDQIFATISSVGPAVPNSTGQWSLELQYLAPDNPWTFTTGGSFTAGSLSQAEWILEATTSCSLSCNVQPLPDLLPGTITFDSFNGHLQQVGSGSATAGNPQFTGSEALSMANPPDQVATPSAPDNDADGFTITLGGAGWPPPPFLLTSALPNAAVGSAYSHDLATSGDLFGFPVIWGPATGVPPGLQFSNGVISGTPQTPGTFAVTLSATETANFSATMTQSTSLTVLPSWPGPADFTVNASSALLVGGGPTGGRPKPCSGQATLSLLPTNGFTGAVHFSVPTNPSRVVTVAPNPTSIGAGSKSIATLSVAYQICPSDSLSAGSLDVTATAGSISHSVKVPVQPPPPTCGTPGHPCS
jgi:hypothetical protein